MDENQRSCTRLDISHLEQVLPLVCAFHDEADISLSSDTRRTAIETLLTQPHLGSIWGIYQGQVLVGYVATCPGFSIEIGGMDAFIDELYLVPKVRGQGLGKWVLQFIKTQMRKEGIIALHLIVADSNQRAIELYEREGFLEWDGFKLRTLSLK